MTGMKLKIKFLVLVISICAWSACRYGPTVKSFPSAQTANGVVADVATTPGAKHVKAELIEVRDAELLILADGKLQLLPYTSIESLDFHGKKGKLDIGKRRVPSSGSRDYLRLVSRFPQGLTPDLLQKLLNANGQTELALESP